MTEDDFRHHANRRFISLYIYTTSDIEPLGSCWLPLQALTFERAIFLRFLLPLFVFSLRTFDGTIQAAGLGQS